MVKLQAHNDWDLPLLGRPKAATDRYLQRLRELINASPRAYGYLRTRWTGKLLSQHLAHELEIEISDRHINRLLQQMGLSMRQRRQHAATLSAQFNHEKFGIEGNNLGSSTVAFSTEKSTGIRIIEAQNVTDFKQVLVLNPLFSAAIENVTDAVEITDSEARYLYVNSAFERVTGYTRQEVLGKTPAALLRSGKHDEVFYRDMFNTVWQGQVWQGSYSGRRKDGPSLDLNVTLSPILSSEGKLTHIVAVKREITERQRLESSIYYQAFHDLLTGLPNRILFQDRLSSALANVRRTQSLLGVMFLDLDRFKAINDSFGHTVGDRLLQAAAERMRNCLREGDTLSRWGGDEFTLLMPQIGDGNEAKSIAQRILTALESTFEIEGHALQCSASIGIAFYPQDGEDAETLLKHADVALYHAKDCGRNCYQFYSVKI
jgi:diguanylate cyclase (GGDEF)-like protein/PAS domain S-box-containing protein